MSIPPGFGKNMEIISFQPHDETLRPITKNVPVTHPKKDNLTEDTSFVLNTELAIPLEYMRLDGLIDAFCANKHNPITVKTELDVLSDVFSYEQLDMRRSKRLKTQPERFISYDAPNFDRDKWKRRGASSTKNDKLQRASYQDLSVKVESSLEEVPVNITPNQAAAGAFVTKENSSSTKRQRMSTRTPVKEKSISEEAKAKNTTQEIASYRYSSVEVDSSCEEVPANITPHQAGACTFLVKEKPSSTKEQYKSTRRTPVKKNPSSDVVKEKSTIQETALDSPIPRTPVKNKEKNHRPPMSFQRNSFTLSRSLNGNSEPAFCQKSGRKRKERMSEREYKQMINQCIGNIQSEMERDFEFPLDVPVMNYHQGAYQEEDFTWPPSADSPDEKEELDDLDDLWKEMDYSLTTVALLEQKQVCVFFCNCSTFS
jgi:DNA repair and recombination RAD54-like protein